MLGIIDELMAPAVIMPVIIKGGIDNYLVQIKE
jgi:hypothetical protein